MLKKGMNKITINFLESWILGMATVVAILTTLFDWNIHMIPVTGMALILLYACIRVSIDQLKELDDCANQVEEQEMDDIFGKKEED